MSITTEQILASEWPLSLDVDFEGACPCATLKGSDFTVSVHCWRVCSRCGYAGVHVRGLESNVAQEVAEYVRDHNGWSNHTDWEIVIESPVKDQNQENSTTE